MPIRSFRTTTTVTQAPQPAPTQPAGNPIVELVEVFGSVDSIAAGTYADVISYRVPDGYAAEVVGIGVKPDYDPDTEASYAWHLKIAKNGEEFWPPRGMKALCRYGLNWFSWGHEDAKKPLFTLGPPGTPGSYTLKFNTGDIINARVYADPANDTGEVYVRLEVVLYNDDACRLYFGVPITALATLPGGHSQGAVQRFLAIDNALNTQTSGAGKWEDVLSRDFKEYEEFEVLKIGVRGHGNAMYVRLRDDRTREVIPHRENGWVVKSGLNMLTFGDALEAIGPYELPPQFRHVFTNTTMQVQLMDANAVVPSGAVAIQVLGRYTYRGGR